MNQKYQVLARRYRPQRFSDVVGQEAILQTLKNGLRRNQLAHAYLFSGSRGTGKTTLARLFAKALNCTAIGAGEEPCGHCPSCLDILSGQSLDVIEIDGASNRGIDDIRQINETVGFAPSHGKYKIYIIDEVHMLTKEAFNALLKTLEEPPERVKFFFATTEPHKVLPTILSRCQRFDLGRLNSSQIVAKLEYIAKDLARDVDIEAIHLLAQYADGSLRDAESLFDQILCFSDAKITATDVRNALGLVPQELFFALDAAFGEQRFDAAFTLVEEVFGSGKDLSHFLVTLIEHYRHIAVVKTRGESALGMPPAFAARYAASAALYSQAQSLWILELLLKTEAQFSRQLSPRTTLELTLLQILRTKNRIPIEALIRRLSELEESVSATGSEDCVPVEKIEERPEKPTSQPMDAEKLGVGQNKDPTPLPNDRPETVVESTLPITPKILQHQQVIEERPEKPTSQPMDAEKLGVGQNKEPTPPPNGRPETVVESALPITPKILQHQQVNEKSQNASKHPSHYATLMRFAAVELEGTVKN